MQQLFLSSRSKIPSHHTERSRRRVQGLLAPKLSCCHSLDYCCCQIPTDRAWLQFCLIADWLLALTDIPRHCYPRKTNKMQLAFMRTPRYYRQQLTLPGECLLENKHKTPVVKASRYYSRKLW